MTCEITLVENDRTNHFERAFIDASDSSYCISEDEDLRRVICQQIKHSSDSMHKDFFIDAFELDQSVQLFFMMQNQIVQRPFFTRGSLPSDSLINSGFQKIDSFISDLEKGIFPDVSEKLLSMAEEIIKSKRREKEGDYSKWAGNVAKGIADYTD